MLPAADLDLVELLQRLHFNSAKYNWKFFMSKSVAYCRVLLQPELQQVLYVGSTTHSPGDRERTRWGKFNTICAATTACGELRLWWHHKNRNCHLPVPLVIMHVPSTNCLRTLERAFIHLLQPRLNAPWVRLLVEAKHSQISSTDPVRSVRRRITSRRQSRRYRRPSLVLRGLTAVSSEQLGDCWINSWTSLQID